MWNMGRWKQWRGIDLIKTLSIQPYLRFYEIMNYPIPLNSELFFQSEKIRSYYHDNLENLPKFSWDKKSKYMDEYIEEIIKLENIFKSIPFVEQIFLCNSITFNALDKDSDIDLFIIAKPWRIWSVKFWSMLLFLLKWAKRFWKNIRKKICLSFFITSDCQNLYPISLQTIDIYLAYWITHLVLIYQPDESINNNFFSQNKWVKWILPNYQEKQTISLWINPIYWNTKFKKIIEKIWNWFIGDIFERLIKIVQKSIIRIKIILKPEINKDVIISDSMLKFHQDIREKISLKYNIKVK